MIQILAISLNTFRETIRDKILYGIVFFAISFILFTMVLGELSLYEERRVIVDMGLAGVSIMSLIAAIVMGVNMLYKEIDRKTLYPILSKPIGRWQFVVGKYLGMNLTLFLQLILMSLVMFGVCYFKGAAITPSIFFVLYLILLEILVVTSIALLFSSFSTPFVSGILTLGVFVVGRNIDLLQSFIKSGKLGWAGKIFSFVPYVFPGLHLFYPSGHNVGDKWISIHHSFVQLDYLFNTTTYGLLYASLCIILAAIVFSRRDLV